MKISQSLIKEVLKTDHCPKQIMYTFIEGREIEDIPDGWKMGRYFESELLGACRGGERQKALFSQINLKPSKSANKPVKISFLEKRGMNTDGLTVAQLDEKLQFEPSEYIDGEKLSAYKECDELVLFAEDIFTKLGIEIKEGESQIDVESELLKGAIDHRNKDIINPEIQANYDLKWTATKENDRWNGWGNPDDKEDSKIQATHYTLLSFEETGVWMPFYFLVFGKSHWVKVIRFKITEEAINKHKQMIAHTSAKIREYSKNNFKGNGSFNKCLSCEFYNDCEDKSQYPEIETYQI